MNDITNIDASERGRVVWHCSDDDGGPDVGLSIGLGNGRSLWVGEITHDAYENGDADARSLGNENGWWLMVYPDRMPLAKFANVEAAREFFDELERLKLSEKTP